MGHASQQTGPSEPQERIVRHAPRWMESQKKTLPSLAAEPVCLAAASIILNPPRHRSFIVAFISSQCSEYRAPSSQCTTLP